MLKCYYAHCIAIYNTPQEKRDIETLKAIGLDVINPNSKAVEEIYKTYGMEYFKGIVRKSDVVAFRANPDGLIGAGAWTEIQEAYRNGIPVIELPSGISRRGMTIEQTREYLKECGKR